MAVKSSLDWRRPVPAWGLVIAVAIIVRVATLGPLWGDEQITVRIVADYELAELLVNVAIHQPHFPTYYALVEMWSWAAQPASARLLSIAAGVATVAGTYRLGQLWTTQRAALVAAILVALSPLLAVQSGWLRMYALLSAVAVWSWWALATQRDAVYVATTVTAVYLHPFGLFLPVAHALWRRRAVVAWAGVAAVPAVVYLATKVFAPSLGTARQVSHVPTEPALETLVLYPAGLLLGSLITPGQFVLAAVVAAVVGWRLWENPAPLAWPCVVWLAVPLVSAAVLSHVVHPILMLKYLGWTAPAVALLTATHLERAGRLGDAVLIWLLAAQALALWVYTETGVLVARTVTYGVLGHL